MGLLSNFRHKFHNVFFTQVLYGTVASLAIFLTSWDNLDRMRDRLQSKLQNDTDTFDFIVVGSGSAGSVVAHRLSQYYSVLLLEAGGEPHPFQSVPGLALFLKNYQEIDWMHRSVPQKRAFGNSLKREASLSQGKGLGGSGNLNFLNYLRGSPLDYDNWKNITGDKSWGYDEMRKYFRLVEDYSKETSQSGSSHGAVKLDIPDYVGLSEEFITGGQQMGYKHVDLNDNFIEGFDLNYYPLVKGIRQGPYQSYLKPARTRKTLTVRKFAHVNKILFRDDSTVAYGVEYERHGETKIAKATKETILCAGALSTAKLLMLSGVGPAQHLQDVGIPLRLDLPVGKNLQDHISTLVGPFFVNESRSLLLGRDIDTRSFLEWGMGGKGPLTSSFFQASALILSTFAKTREEDANWPDIHLQLSSIGVHKTYAQDLAHAYNLQENLVSQYYAHAGGKQSFSISVTNGRPVARGEVLLSGRDPKDKLMINPRYLEDPYNLDVNILKDGVATALKLVENTTSFQKIGARFTDKRLPGCEHVDFRSDAYWVCYIRQYSLSMNSLSGTTPMGKENSKYAVVDSRLKVMGATGLRVIDASIMPTIVVTNPQAAVLAIGEKGADNILEYWRQFDVPSKTREDSKSEHGGKVTSVPDSFAGFSFLGKITSSTARTNGKNGARRNHHHPHHHKVSKQKVKVTATAESKIVTKTTPLASSTTTVPITTFRPFTPKVTEKPDIEHAETRFSHNLNTIMEFLRNSRAINEEIDDHTYNELVQNFGERIVELMKKNKTDIFFVPVSTTEKPVEPTSDLPTSTRRSVPVSEGKNSFGGNSKFFGKAPFSTQNKQPAKQYQPVQYSTTGRPPAKQVTTSGKPLSTYFINNGTPKPPQQVITPPKKVQQLSSPAPYSGKIVSPASGFSPLISSEQASTVSSVPKFTTLPTTSISTEPSTSLRPVSHSPSAFPTGETTIGSTSTEPVDAEDQTEEPAFEEEDIETTLKPENEQTTKKPVKIVELILNPDLTLNKTQEIDDSAPKRVADRERELIEYRTEELRPYPDFPPYKIVPVPGREFLPPGLAPPQSFLEHSHFSGLSPPPQHVHHIAPQPAIQLSIPSFGPVHHDTRHLHPKIPEIIDEHLPIQTAKTVLYYTQVFPRNLNEIRRDGSNNGGQVVRNLEPSLQHEDHSQNIVQFFPTIHK